MKIGEKQLGSKFPPYIIAEAGVHHWNSVDLAKELSTAARIAGADAIKFQTYEAGRIAARWAPAYWSGADKTKTQYDVFATRSRLTDLEYKELADHCKKIGIDFMSTPFHVEAVGLLDKLGVPAFKIASADLTNLPLLRAVAKTGKSLLMSTGAAQMKEVKKTVAALQLSKSNICLLHCNLAYPTPNDQANLLRLGMLAKAAPGVLLGYSDHTLPGERALACPVAVALGARVIEKHFTLNQKLPEDDHYHSVDAEGLAALVHDCHEAFKMTAPALENTPSEAPARANARRSIVASRDLPKNRKLTGKDIDFKRPGTGVSPMEVDRILGKKLKSELKADDLVLWENLE